MKFKSTVRIYRYIFNWDLNTVSEVDDLVWQ